MYDFKKFLFQTEGESSYLFWMDIERIKSSNLRHHFLRHLIIRINHTYIANGSPFQLKALFRDDLSFLQHSDQHNTQLNAQQQLKELVRCQKKVLENLRVYWCKRYYLKGEENKFEGDTDEKQEDEPITCEVKSTDMKPANTITDEHFLPALVTDKGINKRTSHIKVQVSRKSLFPLEEKSVLDYSLSNDTLTKLITLPQIVSGNLISSSTYNLFSTSFSGLQHKLKSKKVKDLDLEPYLYASLRADFTIGNNFLLYLKQVASNTQAVNYLLFWQSVENIFTQDEMEKWFTEWCHASLDERKDKPSPYLNYFESCLIARDLKELCMYFLQPNSICRVKLPFDVMEQLNVLLPRGLGQRLLLSTQEYARKVSILEKETMWELGTGV